MIVFGPFTKDLDRSTFTCGKEELDRWLRYYAGQQERDNTARTIFGMDERQVRIASFYTLVATRLDVAEVEGTALGSRYPVSAVLLARLAVDVDYQGEGLGRVTLYNALANVVDLSEGLGFEAVVVDAIDDEAVRFYQRYGFRQLSDDGRRLFLTTKDLRKTFTRPEG
ncbi:MAG: GNAT family N-acetyltransferase [Micrococcales bacterium]|nr:GNAT family N-acetyltransferase [Micrococcales bacterium]